MALTIASQKAIHAAHSLVEDEHQRRAFVGDNARELFKLSATSRIATCC